MKICARCRKYKNISEFGSRQSNKDKKSDYCATCDSKMRTKDGFNRYKDSDTFISLSFIDSIDGDKWHGFQSVKWNDNIITNICSKYSDIYYICSFMLDNRPNIDTYDKYIYILTNQQQEILKVGQTTNLFSRMNSYHYLPNCKIHIFKTHTWELQDILERKIRNLLEFYGHKLPLDKSDNRHRYI